MTDLQVLAIGQLVPHPDNPRLQLREETISQLTMQISVSGFGQEHAIIARPFGERFQVISGHHRVEAAKRAGLTEVPAWVKELDDAEAFMQLVLCNTQGELSKVEYAIHAFRYSQRGEHGRGKEGGLSAYARRTGRQLPRVSEQYAVGEMLENLRTSEGFPALVRAQPYSQLLEISKAPAQAHVPLTNALVSKGWSARDTAAEVAKIRKFDIPAEHATWLPLHAVTESYLSNDRLNPATVTKLITAAGSVFEYIGREGTVDDGRAFRDWLEENSGRDAWDAKKISGYHRDLIRAIAERKAAEVEAAAEEPSLPDGVDLRHGDFRKVLDGDLDLKDSVDAIITDPPYPEQYLPLFGDLSSIAAWILKPGGICAVMVGQSYLPQILEQMHDCKVPQDLRYHWTLAYLTPGGQAVQLWQRKVNTFWKPVLIYVKGEYAGDWLGDVTRSDVNDNDKEHHHWGQSESGMADLIGRLTKPGQLIVDPFLGGGTTAVVAHALGRRIVACDIDETCIATATARFTASEEAA